MEIDSTGTILVVGSTNRILDEKRAERGIGDKLAGGVVNAISVSVLKKNMESFFHQIREILQEGSDQIGAFQISAIEALAQITGEGQVTLVGSGVKLEAQGGVKFTLCRKPPP